MALARPDLDVWVIGGDGDMLSIGGNHLIHALRRNVNLKIIMFNNQIYGLTKGQYSPTSEVGKITKSSPFGSLDTPFNPVSVALAAEATFVARTHDMDRKGMTTAFRRAHEHQGSAFVEIYQNCNVFNDGAFEGITAKEARADMLIELRHGEPIRFGADNEHGVVLNEFGECEIVDRRRRRRGASARARRDARGSGVGVRAVAAVVGAHDADAGRGVPVDQPSDVRGRGPASGGRMRSSVRGPATSPSWSGPAPPGTSSSQFRRRSGPLGRRPRCGQSSRPRKTIPVRGLGAKNVVFSGMRRPAAAAARIVSTVTGRSSTAASALPFATCAATRDRVVAVGERDARHAPAATPTSKRAESTRAAPPARRACGHRAGGGGTRSARPVAVDETQAAFGVHGRFQRGHPLGNVGARVAHLERGVQPGAQVDPGDAGEQPVDGAHVQLLGGQLDDQRHDRVGARVVDVCSRRSAR